MTINLGSFIVSSEEETKCIARKIASQLQSLDVIAIKGNLGAGKTFFCREIIKSLCGENTKVTSPTFNLLQTYNTPNFEIYHFDLYRLKDIEEIYEIGLEEALNHHVCLIEWPEIIEKILPPNTTIIDIKIVNNKTRNILINNFYNDKLINK